MYDCLKLITRNPTAKEIQKKIEALKRAEAILRARDLGLRRNENEAHRLSTTFEVLRQAQEYLLKIPVGKPGRKFNATVFGPAACALELACAYEHETKSWQWEKVGKAVADAFPEAIPSRNDPDHPTDLRLWAFRSAKRHLKARLMKKNDHHYPKISAPLLWGSITFGLALDNNAPLSISMSQETQLTFRFRVEGMRPWNAAIHVPFSRKTPRGR
jgi:hypothetical protein